MSPLDQIKQLINSSKAVSIEDRKSLLKYLEDLSHAEVSNDETGIKFVNFLNNELDSQENTALAQNNISLLKQLVETREKANNILETLLSPVDTNH